MRTYVLLQKKKKKTLQLPLLLPPARCWCLTISRRGDSKKPPRSLFLNSVLHKEVAMCKSGMLPRGPNTLGKEESSQSTKGRERSAQRVAEDTVERHMHAPTNTPPEKFPAANGSYPFSQTWQKLLYASLSASVPQVVVEVWRNVDCPI